MPDQYVLKQVPLVYVNLRELPNASSRDVGDLYPGAVVEMINPNVYGWAYVTYNGITGYVSLQGGAVVFAPFNPQAEPFHLSLPVAPPGVVTQVYGANPEYYAQWGLPGHEGIDYAGQHGDPVYAAHAGAVKLLAVDNGTHNYGTHVRLTHLDEETGDTYETIYAHLDGFSPSIKQGYHVVDGQVIGYMDSTGNSTGTHLHFTLKKNGIIINPEPYMK